MDMGRLWGPFRTALNRRGYSAQSGAQGSAASANILRRIPISRPYDGWSETIRMIIRLPWRTNRPGRLTRPNLIALRRLFSHSLPIPQLLTARVEVERQCCDGPPGGIGSEQSRGQPPQRQGLS